MVPTWSKAMRRILIILIIFGLASISIGSKPNGNIISDYLYINKIIGSWSEGEIPYTIVTFEIDGKYSCKMWKSPRKIELILSEEGKWWIDNGRLYNTIHKIEPPLIPRKDKPIVDTIVSISDTKMTLIDEEGQQYEKCKIK